MMKMMNRLREYALLTRQNRPIGTILFLSPTAWALLIAGDGQHDIVIIAIFMLGTWLMRSAGCIINDYVDIDFDRHVERTKDRPLTSGRVSKREALVLFSVLSISAFFLVLMLPIQAVFMAIAGLCLAIIYPFMKRFFALPQLILGLAFSWGVPMVFVTYQGVLPMPAIAITLLSVLWILSYDTIYALCDREDDKKIGLKSAAVLFGSYTFLFVLFCQILFLSGWLLAGLSHSASLWFWLGWFATLGCFAYQQYLIKSPHESGDIIKAFNNNQYVGLAIFISLFGF